MLTQIRRAGLLVLTTALAGFSSSGYTQIDFSTDFEGETGITKDGWKWAVNYFSADCSIYESTYDGTANDSDNNIVNLATASGSQKMNVFSNYGDGEQAN